MKASACFPFFLVATLALTTSACAGATPPTDDESVEASEDALVASNEAFLRAMALDLGEYFDWEGSAYEQNLRPVRLAHLDDLSAAVRAAFDAKLAQLNAGMLPGHTAIGDEIFRVVRNGRTIGYVLAVVFHGPAFEEGAGERFYFNTRRRVVASVPWTA